MEHHGLSTPSDTSDEASAESLKPLQVFQYQPLDTSVDSIRLLVLHPASPPSPSVVRCRLIHTNFGSKPSYEAVSYTWGDDNLSKTIILNDIEISVRENLYWALYYMRVEADRILWVDAICIDQSNSVEKQYQVALMGYIYHRAKCVLIWLGCAPRFEKLLNPALFWKPDDSLHNDTQSWIFGHRYWKRLWIIQEIGLSRNLRVCIGGSSYAWDDFISKLRRDYDYGNRGTYIENLHQKRRGRHGSSNRLEALLEDFQYAECKESRDKIYGFLGLAHDCEDDFLVADYTKPLFALYKDVIRFFCQRRLLQNGSTNELDRSMRVVRFSQLVQRLLGMPDLANAGEDRLQPADVVQVRGAIGSEVLHIGPSYNEAISSNMANKQWKSSFKDYYPLPQDVEELRGVFESYSILLNEPKRNFDKFRGIQPSKLYSKAIKSDRVWNRNENEWDHQELDNQVRPDLNDSVSITNATFSIGSPRMFLGSNGIMGLAPRETIEGDIICQFWKTDVVAVLRKEDQGEIYRVVGRAHISTGSLNAELRPVYSLWKEPVEEAKTMVIQLEIETLAFLTC